MSEKSCLTPAQIRAFWKLFGRARDYNGIPSSEADEYRHGILREEIGVSSMKDIRTNAAFDKVMSRLAVEAGDYMEASKWSGGNAMRSRHVALVLASGIVGPGTKPENYIAAILLQGHLYPRWTSVTEDELAGLLSGSDGWLDIPDAAMRTLIQILNFESRKRLHRDGGAE